MERKFRVIEAAKKEAVQEAVSNTIQSMEEEHEAVVQSLRRGSMLEMENKEVAIKELQQVHAEKMQMLENAMDERIEEMTSESNSRYEELQKEKDE
eukprot:1902322-Ditylum_brightwellii.AAC.1